MSVYAPQLIFPSLCTALAKNSKAGQGKAGDAHAEMYYSGIFFHGYGREKVWPMLAILGHLSSCYVI